MLDLVANTSYPLSHLTGPHEENLKSTHGGGESDKSGSESHLAGISEVEVHPGLIVLKSVHTGPGRRVQSRATYPALPHHSGYQSSLWWAEEV